jgi:hypothetical protein
MTRKSTTKSLPFLPTITRFRVLSTLRATAFAAAALATLPVSLLAVNVMPGSAAMAQTATAPVQPIAQSSTQPGAVIAKPSMAAPRMERLAGVWIDGPGYDIVYGGTYDACAARCLATSACAMIEYYRPEKKCNMYMSARTRLNGGSSDVALKR